MDLLQEYSELKKTIDYHMDRYYNQDEPEISDYEYDKLMIRLKEIEKEHPEWVTSDSPSQKIGGTVKREAGVKVTHNVPMLSIEDVFSEDAVCAWIDKVHAMHPDCTFSVETKIDGLSMSLRYVKEADGKLHLQLAETRGDGLIGEDVTANARVVGDVLQVIDLPYDSLELRGEVYMRHVDFEKYNEEQEKLEKKTAANPRNLAAGTLRQLDSSITKKRGLKMFIFNVQDGPDEIMESHGRGMDILKAAGVPVVYHKICKTKEEVDRVKLQKLGELESSLSSVVNDPTIPKSAKLAKAQEILAKTNNIEAAHLEFVKSADYQSMPTDDEKKEQDAADNDISDEITDSEKANNTESTDTTDNTQDKADNVTDDNNNQVSDIENPDTVDTNASEKTSEKDNHKKEYSTEIKKVTRKLKKGPAAAAPPAAPPI